MSEESKPDVEAESADFKRGFAAGLNSAKETRDEQAGDLLGEELSQDKELALQLESGSESTPPLFMRDRSDGDKGDAQDEKDGSAE